MKPGQLEVGIVGPAPSGVHVITVGEAELDVLLVVLRHQETPVGTGPKPRLGTPAGQAPSARPLLREEVGRRVTREVMVCALPGVATQGYRYQLPPICSGPPRERRPVEKGLPETEARTYQFKPVAPPMVEHRELFQDAAGGREGHAVLQPNAGRTIRAEVELAEQNECAVVTVLFEPPVDGPHVPAGQRPAVEARACRSHYGELVAVVFVGDVPSRAQVQQLVGVQGLPHLHPQAPDGIGELELGPAEVIGGVGKQG